MTQSLQEAALDVLTGKDKKDRLKYFEADLSKMFSEKIFNRYYVTPRKTVSSLYFYFTEDQVSYDQAKRMRDYIQSRYKDLYHRLEIQHNAEATGYPKMIIQWDNNNKEAMEIYNALSSSPLYKSYEGRSGKYI